MRKFVPIFILAVLIAVSCIPSLPTPLHADHGRRVSPRTPNPEPRTPGPRIEKVEPPNWWTVKHPTKIQLMITGDHLAGADLTTRSKGVTVENVTVSANGLYLFCDVTVSPKASVGRVEFEIGAATFFWPLLKPLPRKGNFQGVSRSDVLYLIMPDRFADADPTNNEPITGATTFDPRNPRKYHGGDLRGVIRSLDYLKELGVTALWLTPVFDNNDATSDYHGYGMMDFHGVEEHLGTMADYRELAVELHKRGMKLIQDTVPNHTGPGHPWVFNPPTPTWYNGTPENHLNCNFDIPSLVDPNAAGDKKKACVEGWFAGFLPDLNARDPRVKNFFIANALWWTHMSGQDAFRLDTYPYVERSFWRDWQAAVDAEFPTMTDIGEVWNGDAKVVSFFRGGKTQWDGIDTKLKTMFDFPMYYAIRDFALDDAKPASRIPETLAFDSLYGDASTLVTFIGNHDVNRAMTAAKSDARRVRLAYGLLFTLRGIPQLYYGDEIGMEGGDDPDNRRDFPGGFGGANNAFDPSGRTSEQAAMRSEVQALIRLRNAHPALQNGAHATLVSDGKRLAYLRSNSREKILVVANGKADDQTVTIPTGNGLKAGTKLAPLHGNGSPLEVSPNGVEAKLGPFAYHVYLLKE